MSRMQKHVTAIGVAVAVALGSFIPAGAAMLPPAPPKIEKQSEVQQVQHYRRGYYRGHRGYRDRRPGYRYHEGYWYPLAAFTAGAIIGGAIAAPPAPRPVYRNSGINPRHYQWCANRYRSYDSYSNTFQPYNGPRQTCYSPYY